MTIPTSTGRRSTSAKPSRSRICRFLPSTRTVTAATISTGSRSPSSTRCATAWATTTPLPPRPATATRSGSPSRTPASRQAISTSIFAPRSRMPLEKNWLTLVLRSELLRALSEMTPSRLSSSFTAALWPPTPPSASPCTTPTTRWYKAKTRRYVSTIRIIFPISV